MAPAPPHCGGRRLESSLYNCELFRIAPPSRSPMIRRLISKVFGRKSRPPAGSSAQILPLAAHGIIAGALITFGGGLINSFPIVLAGRGLEGLAVAFFLPASTALLLDVFPMAERGGAQGKMMMISMFITAFAPTLIGLIIQAVSWPYAYLLTVAGGVAIINFRSLEGLLRDSPSSRGALRAGRDAATRGRAGGRP